MIVETEGILNKDYDIVYSAWWHAAVHKRTCINLRFIQNTKLESGTDYVEAFSVKPKNYKDLFLLAKELKDNPGQFEYIALDTITALEDLALPFANKLYRDTSMGKNWDENENILKLPNGAGYNK